LQLHLDTRFAQLKTASELELWQESYNSIRDIHGLLTIAMSKKPPAAVIAQYYSNLGQIFLNFEHYLFHAYSVNKYFSLHKAHHKTLSEDESRVYVPLEYLTDQLRMASSLLLAALCSPIKDVDITELDSTQSQRFMDMATLLSLTNVPVFPTREQLVEELTSKNISNLVLPELKDFLNLMEKRFNPLGFCAAVKPKLDFIAGHPTLKVYTKPLERLMFIRLLQQVKIGFNKS
jgi:translation initiation factor 3 subunit A